MSKTVTITVADGQKRLKVPHDISRNLLETFLQENFIEGSFCKGLSRCGHCKVRFVKNAPYPSARERSFFSAEELRDGFRLACQVRPKQDYVVELHFGKDSSMEIVSDSIVCTDKETDGAEKKEAGKLLQTETYAPDGERDNVSRGQRRKNERTFVAVDIGTTTVVMQLVDAVTEEVIHTVKFMNPQRSFGFDVLSRIQAAKEQGEVLKKLIQNAIVQGVETLRKQRGCGAVPELLCVTGNTAMLHIFMGYDTEGLGKSPFQPVSVACEETVLDGIRTVVMPSVSAFVGADVTAGILAAKMQEREQINLLIDLGTNGEMALGNREKILTCATAAGSAFEGGAENGIYGSDRIGAVAILLEQRKVEESGYMEEATICNYQGKAVEITLEKIRELQLAKAAVRAGIEILVRKYGLKSLKEIDNVYFAGGFGFFLDAHAAVKVGLIPAILEEKVKAIGNSALAGARRFGKDYLRGKEVAKQSVCMERISSFNLAEEDEFQELYIQYMNF
ncbi:MAG: DUF4445 domain-containing protein [Lachnospiraceae bacterium]|nr:DUF4445 domain-containing protein [Lachnospiraceae bacterium]